jgi:hypothetical protein
MIQNSDAKWTYQPTRGSDQVVFNLDLVHVKEGSTLMVVNHSILFLPILANLYY